MFIISADDVAQRRGFCNHFVTMRVCVCVCVQRGCVCVCTIKRKLLIGMTSHLEHNTSARQSAESY